jgi:hypothetical protein
LNLPELLPTSVAGQLRASILSALRIHNGSLCTWRVIGNKLIISAFLPKHISLRLKLTILATSLAPQLPPP